MRSANTAIATITIRITSPSMAALFFLNRYHTSFLTAFFRFFSLSTALTSLLVLGLDSWINEGIENINQKNNEAE